MKYADRFVVDPGVLVLEKPGRKYADDQPRDDHGRFSDGGSGSSDPTGEIKASTVDGAWTALNADRFDLEAQQSAHPENYEPNRGYGVHLKEGATEWRRDVSSDGVPTIYQVIGTDNRTLPPGDRAGAGLPMTAPDGTPVIAARVDGSDRPDPYVYRVVSVSEFDQAQARGYFQSNQSMNLANEGTVASRGSTGTFYAPPNGESMRVVQFDMHPEDGWKVDTDGYVKTPDPVPFDRAHAYSTPLANPRAPKASKYDDAEPRDDHGRWTSGGGDTAATDLTTTHAALYGDHAGTPTDPVPCGSDIERAAKIIADGGNVSLNQPQEIATLLDKMQEIGKEAEAKGEKAPTFDLCDVSVPGTNLFCQDHVVDDQGNPLDRIQMPQLVTTDPVPGSPADQLPRNQFGEVDMSTKFAEFLSETGRPPVEETVDAATLRASQDQLNGAKVAGIVDAIQAGTYDVTTGRIWITSDNYVIDGHHRWAAAVTEGYATGQPVELPVRRLDMDIGTALTTANYWTEEQGIQGRSLTAKSRVVLREDALTVDQARLMIGLASLGLKYDPTQERDGNGRWTSGGGDGALMIDAAALGIVMPTKFDPSQIRDDHGRWTSGGGGALGDVKPGATDQGHVNNGALALALERTRVSGSDEEDAKAAKIANVKEIGATLADRAQSDPELAAGLRGAGEFALGRYPAGTATAGPDDPTPLGYTVGDDGKIAGIGTAYQDKYLQLEPGMTLEQVGANEVAAKMQDTWMMSASDSNALSWGEQFAVADRLGVDTSAAEAMLTTTGSDRPSGPLMTDDHAPEIGLPPTPDGLSAVERVQYLADAPAVKAYVDTVYNRTQSFLADNGVKGDVTLYRGVGIFGDAPLPQGGRVGEVTLNPISSFSMDDTTAAGFGATVYEATVPTNRIFSLPTTGPGCLAEDEAIVAGGEHISVNAMENPDAYGG